MNEEKKEKFKESAVELRKLIRLSFRKMPLFVLLITTILLASLVGLIGQRTFLKKYGRIDFLKEPYFSAVVFGVKDLVNGKEDVVIPSSALKQETSSEKKAEVPSEREMERAKQERLTIPKGVNNEVVGATDYGVANRGIMVDDSTVFTTDVTGYFAPDGTYRYLEKAKDDSYFSDALMIGDSRTVGLAAWSSLAGKTNFFCKESMSVFSIATKELDYTGVNGETGSTTLDNLLSTHKYGKVYISLGINEMGFPVMQYYQGYRDLVEKIHKALPDAIIYIEGNMHVGLSRSSTDAVFNNTNLVQRNRAIASLANGRDTFYIDPNTAVCDSDGNLVADYTTDGIHLKAVYYNKWVDFLRRNTIDPSVAPAKPDVKGKK